MRAISARVWSGKHFVKSPFYHLRCLKTLRIFFKKLLLISNQPRHLCFTFTSFFYQSWTIDRLIHSNSFDFIIYMPTDNLTLTLFLLLNDLFFQLIFFISFENSFFDFLIMLHRLLIYMVCPLCLFINQIFSSLF